MKTCYKCKKEKAVSEFYKDCGSPGGYRHDCKECKNNATSAWRAKNQDYYNSSMREYQRKHKLERDNCDLKRKYGLSRTQFDMILNAQNQKCAVCQKANPSKKRRLAVDHNHRTGEVRGIVCYGCNRLLVALDDVELFKQLNNYLQNPPARAILPKKEFP